MFQWRLVTLPNCKYNKRLNRSRISEKNIIGELLKYKKYL